MLELPLGRAPPQGARLELEGELRAPPGPSNGFDEARWLRRQGIHAVLRGQAWHVVGRRGGVFGAGDGIGRWLARDSAPGLTGDRRDVIEAIVLGRSSGMDQTLLADFRASGLYHCLAVDGLKVAAVGGGIAALCLLAGLRELRRPDRGAAQRRRVCPRGRTSSVRCAGGARRRARVARLARRPRARPVAGVTRRRCAPPRLEPVHAVRCGLPALVRSGRLDLRRHAARRPRPRGLSRVARAGAADRRVDGVRPCDRARDVVPVPSDLARHRSRERRGGPRRRRGARAGAPDGCRRAGCAARRGGDGTAQRRGRLGRRRLRAGVRRHARSTDHVESGGRVARPGSSRCRRLCLAPWRASAS